MRSKDVVRMLGILLAALMLVTAAGAQTGTLKIEPATGSYAVGDEWDIQVKVDTGGETVMTVQTYIDYDPTMVEVVGGDAGIAVDSAFALVVEKTVDTTENKIKIVGGALSGASGSDVAFATISLKALADGTADITFDQANSAAQDAGTNNVIGSYEDGSYTIGGAGPIRYDFDADAEGWQFSGAVSTFDEPTNTVAGGALNLQATGSNCFGFWYSPADAIPELQADSLYRARFNIKSDQADKTMTPSFRIRWNASNFMQGDTVMVNSNADAEASPDATAIDYDLYFRPQGEALNTGVTGILAFDLINMSALDAADAIVSMDYVQVDRVDLPTESTSVQSYTFDADAEGWTSTDPIGAFDQPIFAHDATGFLMMQSDSSNNTFGFYQNPEADVSLDNSALYQLRVKAGAGAEGGDPPLMRVRMYDHPSNQMCAMFQTPVWTEYIKTDGARQVTFQDYYAYFHNSLGLGPNLGIAVDIVNLDPAMDSNGIVEIDEVELSTMTIPTF